MMQQAVFQNETTGLQYLINNYAQYNLWANATIVHWLKSKPYHLLEDAQLSSFPSIKLTLQHILNVQIYWFAQIIRREPQVIIWDTKTVEDTFMILIDQSAEIAEMIESMSLENLSSEKVVINPWFECRFPKFEYVMQLVNHSTYHRGQIVSTGHQLGFTDAPMTDYNFYNVRGKI